MGTLCPPGGKRLRHIGRVDVLKSTIGVLVGAVVRWRVLFGQGTTEPVAFDLGHMAHEPEQRQRRWWDGPPAELLRRYTTAFPLQGEAVKVEPCFEHFPLWGRPRRRRSWNLHRGSPRIQERGRGPYIGTAHQTED